MKYKFVEIGCCDFNTQNDTLQNDSIGLCVDPIEYYLNNLPDKSNLVKAHCAISNKRSNVNVYYLSEKTILEYNLPMWLRGCNKIEGIHPTVVKELTARNLPLDLINIDNIITTTYEDLVLKYECCDIDYLKIDTEGNEPDIIDSLYNFYKNKSSTGYNMPLKINVEAFIGILVDNADIEILKEKLFDLGYFISELNPPDIIFSLR